MPSAPTARCSRASGAAASRGGLGRVHARVDRHDRGTRRATDSPSPSAPTGELLAVGGYGKVVRLWDVRTGKLVHELDQGGAGALTLEFSADGSTLAVSGFEPAASLWDVATRDPDRPELTAGRRRAMVDLSSDGRQCWAHGNGQGAVWDVDPGSWKRRACALANRTLTREEWERFLPGRPYKPACAS